MSTFMLYVVSFIADVKERLYSEKGATMVEYGIMVALIAVVVLAAVGPLGTAIKTMFDGVTTSL